MKRITAIAWLFSSLSLVAGIHDEPDGVSIALSDDGNYKIISIGTGVYDFNEPDDILAARKEAERNAKANIAKFFQESLATEESAAQQTSKVKKLGSDGTAEVSKTVAKQTLESIRTSASKLLKGVVILEDEKVPFGEKNGTFRVMVGVSSATLAAASGDVRTTPSAENSNAPAPAQDGWIVYIGVGDDRKSAVRAALLEGISQVYGEQLRNDERQVERIKKFKINDFVVNIKDKETQSSTLSSTAGFVQEYRIEQVVSKHGHLGATVRAFIVNPKAGGTLALRILEPKMTTADKATVYQLGPGKRMSGAEIAKAVQFALPLGVSHANRFLVLGGDDGLSPDLSLATEISDVVYSKKLGQNRKTKKFGPQQKLLVTLNVSLTDERTGTLVKNETLTLSLDNEEIVALQSVDENADLLQAAFAKLAEVLGKWVEKKQA